MRLSLDHSITTGHSISKEGIVTEQMGDSLSTMRPSWPHNEKGSKHPQDDKNDEQWRISCFLFANHKTPSPAVRITRLLSSLRGISGEHRRCSHEAQSQFWAAAHVSES